MYQFVNGAGRIPPLQVAAEVIVALVAPVLVLRLVVFAEADLTTPELEAFVLVAEEPLALEDVDAPRALSM